MSWLETLKRKMIRPLAKALAADQERSRGEASAVLGTGSVLAPESMVENLSGIRQKMAIGQNSYIRGHLLTFPNGGSIHIGSWCYVGSRSEIWSMESVTIGDRVLISHNVNILDSACHSKNAAERHAHFRAIITTGHPRSFAELPGVACSPVVIGDDVWICAGATILPGVKIGPRSIIAAGSLVRRDVPPDTLFRNELKPIITPL